MSLVVSDTGPLHYLVLTEAVDVLPLLFEKVVLPSSVLLELRNEKTPERVRAWATSLPSWVSVQKGPPFSTAVPLDPGELEAISLALSLKADFLLIDEKKGRAVAKGLQIRITGTLGILEIASERRFLNFEEAVNALRATNCYLSDAVLNAALERFAQRKQ